MQVIKNTEHHRYTLIITGEKLGNLYIRSNDGKYGVIATVVFDPYKGKIKYGKETGWTLPVDLIIYFDTVYKKYLKMKAFI